MASCGFSERGKRGGPEGEKHKTKEGKKITAVSQNYSTRATIIKWG